MKISGIVQLESANDAAKSKGGGSTYSGPSSAKN